MLRTATCALRRTASAGRPPQKEVEDKLIAAIAREGFAARRAHEYDAAKGHGFIDSQKRGLEVFRALDRKLPLIVVEAVWQYSQHILAGLMSREGPILTVANWSGQWPGLVGMLNLNGSLTRRGRPPIRRSGAKISPTSSFSTACAAGSAGKRCATRAATCGRADDMMLPHKAQLVGRDVARDLQDKKAIMGVFDEGCMGMFNAIIPDRLLAPTGRVQGTAQQSRSVGPAMQEVTQEEAAEIRAWLDAKGMRFNTGADEASELTDAQILMQCRMYIAALRIADEFGCDAVGIQYQQGLKDICPASDLVEGLLNNVDRPPGPGRRTAARFTRGGRCRTSTRWMSAPASMR